MQQVVTCSSVSRKSALFVNKHAIVQSSPQASLRSAGNQSSLYCLATASIPHYPSSESPPVDARLQFRPPLLSTSPMTQYLRVFYSAIASVPLRVAGSTAGS